MQPEHKKCSDGGGQRAVIEKAKREAGFSEESDPVPSPLLPFSPREDQFAPIEVREDLGWANASIDPPSWLTSLLTVPEDASPPLAATPPHPRARGSYGAEAVEWIETNLSVRLRWWQKFVVTRMLEHDADGFLCWRTVLLSASRRSGKSLLLRSLACWRMAHADLLGETQTVMHFGSDTAITREVQRGAWRWAEDVAGWTVSRANGKEALETPDGDRWLVRAQTAVYGYDVCFGLGDEVWDVDEGTVSDGVEPAMLERQSPQLLLTSTAHRKAKSTMRSRLSAALGSAPDPDTLLLLWAALPQDDPSSLDTWRKASPHWTEDRERTIRAKWLAALDGSAAPELGEDPMQSFTSQYLNVWNLTGNSLDRGDVLLSPAEWAALEADLPADIPTSAAIESWYADGVTLAFGYRLESGQVVTSAHNYPDLSAAVAALRDTGYRGVTMVGASLLTDPALRDVRVRKGEGRSAQAALSFQRLVSEDAVRHDGSEHLTGQVLAVRTTPGIDGPRLVSKGRTDAVKAAAWAIEMARTRRKGIQKIIVAAP